MFCLAPLNIPQRSRAQYYLRRPSPTAVSGGCCDLFSCLAQSLAGKRAVALHQNSSSNSSERHFLTTGERYLLSSLINQFREQTVQTRGFNGDDFHKTYFLLMT